MSELYFLFPSVKGKLNPTITTCKQIESLLGTTRRARLTLTFDLLK